MTTTPHPTPQKTKLAFLTTGATAPFPQLVRSALHPTFLTALAQNHYTDLLLQHGRGGAPLLEQALPLDTAGKRSFAGVRIAGFSFRADGLAEEFAAAKGVAPPSFPAPRNDDDDDSGGEKEGVVITHAGAGSILEGLRMGVAMIVVANPRLLDNHQEELAEELARQGYVVAGRLVGEDGKAGVEAGAEALVRALTAVEERRGRVKGWPPVNAGWSGGVGGVLDEEVARGRLD